MLCYSDDLFLQVLEGGRDEVCELYNTIVRDDRHSNVRILIYEEIAERRFGNWTMGHVNVATVEQFVAAAQVRQAAGTQSIQLFRTSVDGLVRRTDGDGIGGGELKIRAGPWVTSGQRGATTWHGRGGGPPGDRDGGRPGISAVRFRSPTTAASSRSTPGWVGSPGGATARTRPFTIRTVDTLDGVQHPARS